MQRFLSFLLLLATASVIFAFQPVQISEEVEAMVQKEIAEKVEAFRERSRQDCWKKAIAEASDIVDSLLVLKIKAIRMDSVQRPDKPVKPLVPELKKLEDTLPVAPLLPIGKERKDSL